MGIGDAKAIQDVALQRLHGLCVGISRVVVSQQMHTRANSGRLNFLLCVLCHTRNLTLLWLAPA